MSEPRDARRFDASTFDPSTFDTTLDKLTGGRPKIRYGAEFDQWLIQRSYSLLAPICRMGFWVLFAVSLAWDALVYSQQLWLKNPIYLDLPPLQIAMLLFFGSFAWLARKDATPGVQKIVLGSFLILGQSVFTWFGFVAWGLYRDQSIFTVSSMVVACVFSYPGWLRSFLYVGSAAVLATLIHLDGGAPGYFLDGNVANQIDVVIICFFIDRFMMNLNRALYGRQCMVEHERARADEILYNALPTHIANELKESNVVKAEKFDGMTVLFADIVGFTRFSSTVPPDAAVYVLNQIFSQFDAVVDRHPAEKIKTIGDAYMVVAKDNCAAIADLALEFMSSIAIYNKRNGVDFGIRIGIHVGPTAAGVIGLKRFLYDVWGDAVNTASRMESNGVAGKIQVTDAIRELLKNEYAFENRGEIEIKGKGLMKTHFLLGRLPA